MTDEVPIPNEPLRPEELELLARLTTQQVEAIDDAIMACAFPYWRKVAAIVGFAKKKLDPQYPQFSYSFYAERIRVLVGQRRLESQGELSFMRFSEVRLPDEN